MTVTYTAQVATCNFANFLKLLSRWKGSVYKLLWREFLLFALLFFSISVIYRFALNETYQRMFESVAKYCQAYNDLIPVTFVLGFYVSLVVQRWWDQFTRIPWPDGIAMLIMASVQGVDERGRLMRRTMMRYICFAFVITMSSISTAVKKRFPTFSHMTEAGFMLPNEEPVLEKIATPYNKYYVPLVWCASLMVRARKENRIKDDFAMKTLLDELNIFRARLSSLHHYDWISIPLVYTQVVTLSVYSFFISCLFSSQFLEYQNHSDVYIPIFTFLQFFFYMGWLKVAESLVNPFGEDDDDFNINWVIDKNLHVSYLIVDDMHQEHPELIRDQYWDSVNFDLPYTAASESQRVTDPLLGSTMNMNIKPEDAEFVQMPAILEDNDVVVVTDDGKKITRSPSHRKISSHSLFANLSFKRRVSSTQRFTHRPSISTTSSNSASGHKLSVPDNRCNSVTSAPVQLSPASKSRRSGAPQTLFQLGGDTDENVRKSSSSDNEAAIRLTNNGESGDATSSVIVTSEPQPVMDEYSALLSPVLEESVASSSPLNTPTKTSTDTASDSSSNA